MRKVDPQSLCTDFEQEIDSFIQFYQDGVGSLLALSNSKSRISLLSELVFHRGYVALESFISAWFIGCINRDTSQYLNFRENSIRQSVQSKFTLWDDSHLSYSPPKHPPFAQIASLLDKEEKNLTFKDFSQMKQRACDWLITDWYDKIKNISPERQAILDAAKSIRNCIAHQSPNSFQEMNQYIQQLPTTGNANLLKREINSVNNVGAYLKAKQQNKSRVEIFLDEFKAFGSELK